MQDELLKKSRKKKRRKVAILLILTVFAVMAAVTVKLRTERDVTPHPAGKAAGRATISIQCKELVNDFSKLKNKNLKKYIPKDGMILKKTMIDIKKGTTAYDVLKQACGENGIAFIKEQKAGYSGVYIKSLGHLAEFDAGKKSGWMYSVNGKHPNLSCSQYKVKNRDKILWHYVVDYNSKN